ncbi:MAG TPA: UDP-N-acetylglucosamine 2-epimerase (non-hydrolyzing) [Planctomycetota bacterium]|nr:UDP-N-acetylglucosamine 2-epimerase (non-hydrolyzing) [Planctomycetota bacterium]
MNTILIIVGTRPEAIKMAPVVHALRARKDWRTILCVTAQHREMLDQALAMFDLMPDIDLNLMTPGQDLAGLTARIVIGVRDTIRQAKPDIVLVHGDTTTCLASALAAFYERVPVGHVEAGLRTYDFDAPWPEEMNRRLVDPLCKWCFAPTDSAAANLRGEHISDDRIFVTGNTAIDALNMAVRLVTVEKPSVEGFDEKELNARKMILVTGHRRENFGAGMEQICAALREIAERNADALIVYPVHLNPNVIEPVKRIMSGHPRIKLIVPQPYLPFVWLMQQSTLILTDSGGIQEEGPSLGKPVLVMRDVTERPEAIAAGTARLVGTDRAKIVTESERLLHDPAARAAMTGVGNPYGDGKAAERIVKILARA